jgi:hypothetical protein
LCCRQYAEDVLKLAPQLRNDPSYSAAVFSADLLAASVAAHDGDLQRALRYLNNASKVPPSEEMAYLSFWGVMRAYRHVCRILIDSGYRPDALAFLEHFATINIAQRDETLRLAADVRAGKSVP